MGAIPVATAAGATTPVVCGNNSALVAAINAANANVDADTIDVTGAPCTFSLTAPAVNGGGNNTGLPVVTTPITIAGHGATIERAVGAILPFRILFANGATANLTLTDLTVKGGALTNGNVGAGLATFGGAALNLDRVTVTQNVVAGGTGVSAASGGGMWTSGGTVTIDHSAFTSNTAHISGAMSLNGTATSVRRSYFASNSTTNPQGGSGSAGVAWVQGGTVNIENSTFSRNTAQNSLGGIAASNLGATAGTLNVSSSTFADNGSTAGTAPGGALFRLPNGGAVTINVTDTIVTDTDSTAAATLAPCTGVTNGGSNIEWPGSTCGFGNTADPKLAPIALNDGLTSNYRPQFDSPAIDLSGATCPATDQRDVARPDGEGCDTGSYETPAPDTTASGPSQPTNDPQVTFSSPDTPTATFECKVDTGSFAACTSPFSPTVGSGTHTVQVRAVHPSAYLDKTPAAVTFTVDKTAPVVTITNSPPSPTPDDTPSFSFTVDDGEATVTCKVDDLAAEPCSSPYTTPPLSDGSHTITISAIDAVGNTGSASRTIVVDTAPSQTLPVACDDVAALRAAITAANATLAHDTIDVTGGPCTFTLHDSVNPASGGSGLPIVLHPLTVEGHGATIERSADAGTPNFRIWFVAGTVDPATTLTLRHLTVLRGSLAGGNVGAGIASFAAGLTLDGVTVQQNIATGGGSNGGGVWTFGGTLDVDRSSFFLNQAITAGALATILTPGTVRRSTFFLNGGALTSSGATAWVQGERVTFENDTIAGNVAANGIGGIVASNSGATSGVVDVASSTLFNNRRTGVNAPGAHLLTFHQAGSGTETIHVTDTIVTDSSTAAPVLPACSGAITNDDGNIEWPGTSCVFATHADPLLDPAIGLHGGTTFNYRPLPASPAIDLGGANCPAVDQRDVSRPDGDGCDAGSYETPAPETAIDGPATNPTNNPRLTFSSPDTPGATFECRIDDGSFATCTSPYTPQLSDGQHTVAVRAVDAGGYIDQSPAIATFTVDATAPVVDITSSTPSPTADTTPTITFTVDDPSATVECKVDGGAREPCSSPFTTQELPEGKHTITVYATDPAGNEGSDAVTIAISFGPPETTITSGPSGTIYNETSATFTFTSSKPNSTFECRLDDAPFADCTSPKTVSGYAPGTHTFQVRALDIAGVPDPTPASRTFTYRHCNVLKVVVDIFGNKTVICL